MAEVAVLGTGRMGAAIARRLAAVGHRVTVWNRTPDAAQTVADASAGRITRSERPADAVRGRSMVISMLADGAATMHVLLDADVLAALAPDAVVCDLGTSGPAAAAALDAGLTSAKKMFLDAPVSGSVPAVEAGTLLVMAAGTESALAAAQPVLSALADRIIRVGPAGCGQAMKLAVNLVLHDLNSAVAESLQLAERSGIAREAAYDVLTQSVVGAPYLQYKRQAFLDPGSPVAMSLDLVAKDLGLITEHAERSGLTAPVTRAVLQAVQAACAAGLGRRDMANLSFHDPN